MTISAYLLHTGEPIRHANITVSDFATQRSMIYRIKRSLSVSQLRHAVTESGDSLEIKLHGSALSITAERIDTL